MLENARLEGVAGRVEVRDGDARRLPFTDASFDVILSCLALHNIRSRAGRQQAVLEIARVLKPGGLVLLVDLRHTRDYVRVLHGCGLGDARRWAVGGVYFSLLAVLTWGAVRFSWLTGKKAPAIATPRPEPGIAVPQVPGHRV